MKWINKGKQFSEIAGHFRKKNKLRIYGGGECGKLFFNEVLSPFFYSAIDCFIDCDTEKQKSLMFGYPVIDPSEIFDHHDEKHIIVVAMSGEKAERLCQRLERAGYVRGWDFFSFDDSIWSELNGKFLSLFALYSMNKLYVASRCVVPDTRCNLKCRDCLNFSPYVRQHATRELEDVCRDADLYFKWVDYTERYQISGGEPLLYPYVKDLIDYIGGRYRIQIGAYETIMNGTVIPSDAICEIIKKNNMTVYLDNYTGSISKHLDKRMEIIDKLDRYGIKWIDNTVDKWFSLDILHTDNSSMAESQLIEYFDNCNNPWHCFENGKMYSCNFARFAMKAGLYEDSKNDHFDFRELSLEKRGELLEFLLGYTDKGYVDFCKKCAGWGSINKIIVPVAVQMDGE